MKGETMYSYMWTMWPDVAIKKVTSLHTFLRSCTFHQYSVTILIEDYVIVWYFTM